MSSELRIKCFVGDRSSEDPGAAPCSFGSSRKSWITTGDNRRLRESLAALLEQLDSAAGDYVVKVFVHRKLDDPGVRSTSRCAEVEPAVSLPPPPEPSRPYPLSLDREHARERRACDQPAAWVGVN